MHAVCRVVRYLAESSQLCFGPILEVGKQDQRDGKRLGVWWEKAMGVSPGCESWLCHFLALCFWAATRLRVLIRKLEKSRALQWDIVICRVWCLASQCSAHGNCYHCIRGWDSNRGPVLRCFPNHVQTMSITPFPKTSLSSPTSWAWGLISPGPAGCCCP